MKDLKTILNFFNLRNLTGRIFWFALFASTPILFETILHPLLTHAQGTPWQYTFQSLPVQGPILNASPGGSAPTYGVSTYYYAVVANYVGGSVASNIVTVQNAPSTLTATSLIGLQWSPMAGVGVTYDVLRLSSPVLPLGTNTIALHQSLVATTATDTGTGLSSYTLANPPPSALVNLQYNSRDYYAPQFEIVSPNGQRPGVALSTEVTLFVPVTTNGGTGGVTIPAPSLVNGIFTHNPTGDVNDTTDTATNIIANLPFCMVVPTGTTGGTGFNFSVRNTSSGANTITVVGGTNVNIVGTATVAQNAIRTFKGVVTACTGTPAVSLYSLGSGAF